MHVLVPDHPTPTWDQRLAASGWRDDLDVLATSGERQPHQSTSLIGLAATINGDRAYWNVTAADPVAWTLTVNEARAPSWHDVDGSCTSWLVALMEGSEREPLPEGLVLPWSFVSA